MKKCMAKRRQNVFYHSFKTAMGEEAVVEAKKYLVFFKIINI
jgi:hypothetical protein